MYNSEIKQKYIEYVKATATTAASRVEKQKNLEIIFNELEPFEVKKDKDFAKFTYDEMAEILSYSLNKITIYRKNVIRYLKEYLDWAILREYSLDNKNRLKDATPDDFSSKNDVIECMVKDEDQLIERINYCFRPMEQNTVDSMYRVLLLLIFSGFKFEEVLDLKVSNVDFNEKTLFYKDYKYKLSDYTLTCIRLVRSMKRFEYPTKSDRYLLPENDNIYRMLASSKEKAITSTRATCSVALKKWREKNNYTRSMTFKSVWRSGVFYRAYLKEQEYGTTDFWPFLPNTKKSISEYQRWKRNFNL